MSDSGTTDRHIFFVDQPAAGDVVLLSLHDPSTRFAVLRDGTGADLEVALLTETKQGAVPAGSLDAPVVYVKYRGVELLWRPGRAVLQCEADQAEPLLAALAEFAHYERELRRIEEGVAEAWPEIQQDKAVAFDATNADLGRSDEIGGRMGRAFQRRIDFARTEPHLYTPALQLPAAAQKLGAELRERAQLEARAEAVDAQLEVAEHIYEMASQRMGEFKAAREGHHIEWIIIWILLAEAILMVIQVVFRLEK